MAVSALNSLIWKVGDSNKPRKIEYLNKKYELLNELQLPKQADETLSAIMKLDPANITLKG